MPDLVQAASGSGGPDFRVDNDTSTGGSVNWPVAKVVFGTEGAYNYAATGSGLPVQGTVSLATGNVSIGSVTLNAGTATVGTVALQSAAAVAINAGTATIGNVGISGTVTVSDGGNSLTVDGTVALGAGTATVGTVALQAAAAAALNAGTATVGTVALQAAAAVAINAGTATVGTAIAVKQSNTMYSGAGAVTPQFAAISITASGDTTLVTGVTNKKIRVISMHVQNTAAGNLRFESGAGGTALTGQMPMASTSGSGFALNECSVGHFETATGAALSAEWDAAGTVAGHMTYIEAT